VVAAKLPPARLLGGWGRRAEGEPLCNITRCKKNLKFGIKTSMLVLSTSAARKVPLLFSSWRLIMCLGQNIADSSQHENLQSKQQLTGRHLLRSTLSGISGQAIK
jgi:hypothetical protein